MVELNYYKINNMRHLYYALLAVAAIVLLSICFLDLGIDRKSNVVIALLCFIFFVLLIGKVM